MSDDDGVIRARAGSGLDLAHRMDRMEAKHEDLAKEVASLSSVVARVEQNQSHATELSKLRFDALDAGLHAVSENLVQFQKRIEGILTGEVRTAQQAQGEAIVADYQKWRTSVDAFIDEQTIRNARQAGAVATIGASRAFVLMLAAIIAPAATIIALVLNNR